MRSTPDCLAALLEGRVCLRNRGRKINMTVTEPVPSHTPPSIDWRDVAHFGISSKVARWIMLLGVLLGIACQLQEYAHDTSYWHDEASIVLNVRNRSAAHLLQTLDYDQAAPPLFLLAERGLFKTLGDGEMSLRLLPLISGILAVIAFAFLARSLLATPWDAFATILFALSDHLVSRATEVKPYASDVLVCVALLLGASEGKASSRSAMSRMAWLAVVGVVGVALSFPAIFVFAALSLALLPKIIQNSGAIDNLSLIAEGESPRILPAEPGASALGYQRSDGHVFKWNKPLFAYFLLNIPVVLTFAGVFWISHAAQQNSTLNSEWENQFLSWHRPWTWPFWMLRQFWAACDYGFPATGPVVLAGAIAGAVALYRARRFQLLAMLIGPIAMTILTAVVHKYPFDGGRLTFFLTPCILLLTMFGIQWFYDVTKSRIGHVSIIPLGYMLAVAIFWAGLHAVVPRHRENLRPIVTYVRAHMLATDTVYIFELRVLQVYWRNPDPNQVRWRLDNADQIPRRFWIVWAYSNSKGQHQPDGTLAWAREFCQEKDGIITPGGAAILFERNGTAMPSKPQAPFRSPFEVVAW
jgi:hypothetical protein